MKLTAKQIQAIASELEKLDITPQAYLQIRSDGSAVAAVEIQDPWIHEWIHVDRDGIPIRRKPV